MHQIPVARRFLLADPLRLAASALGVGTALMLILLLNGLWAGIRAQVTVYEDHTGAQLYVAAPGTLNLFGDGSVLPTSTVATIRATPGVAWATPVRTLYSVFELHGRKEAVALIGAVPGQRGGAWSLASGRAPVADDEIVVDRVLADRHHLRVGSTVAAQGATMRVVGIARGASGFMVGLVFVTHHVTDLALRSPGTTSEVLVGTSDPAGVRNRLTAQGLTVVDQAQLRRASLNLATHVYGTPLRLMVGVGFAAGTLVIALTAYAAVVDRRRDYGIIKALGAGRARLAGLAVAQSLGLAVLGAATSAVLFVVGRAVIGAVRPQFLILLTPASAAQAGLAALGMALLAALIPARRLADLDPAVAFRSS